MATVLIVDDDTDIRAVMRLALEDLNCPMDECTGADSALAWLLGNIRPDQAAVILLDDQMPPKRGVELLRKLARGEAPHDHHRIILMTADPQAAHAAEMDASLRGVLSAVLVKPFDLDVLEALVRHWLADLAT